MDAGARRELPIAEGAELFGAEDLVQLTFGTLAIATNQLLGHGDSQDNSRVQRARVIDSTQVKTADRGLRLQPSVIRIIVQAGVLIAIHDISRLSRCES